jgi:hypothetical protein
VGKARVVVAHVVASAMVRVVWHRERRRQERSGRYTGFSNVPVPPHERERCMAREIWPAFYTTQTMG